MMPTVIGSAMIQAGLAALDSADRVSREAATARAIGPRGALYIPPRIAPLPQRDHQSVEVGGDDQSGLTARQLEHCAILVGQQDGAPAADDRSAAPTAP